MSITSENRVSGPYSANGATTVFAFSFAVQSAADLKVVQALDGLETELTTGFTISVNADQVVSPGGSITFSVAPASPKTITLTSDVAYTQPTVLTKFGGFYPSVINGALDRIVMLIQQLKDLTGRSLRLPVSAASGVSTELPVPESQKLIGWNETETGLQNFDSSALATLTAYGTANADQFTGDGTTVAFTLSDNPVVIANLDVSVGGVVQLPTTDYTLSGTTLTFTTAPPNSAPILARYMRGLPQSSADAAGTSYVPSGSGAVTTTVQSKLRQFVTPEDFGAAGDGTTDDSAAIRAACAALSNYGTVLFAAGKRYRFEHTQVNPYTGVGTQAGYVFNGKTGIRVLAQGATFVTTTVNNAVLGLFTFYDCTDCVTYGGTSEGSYTPDSVWTGAYVAFMGLSKNCRVEQGSQRGGYGLAVIIDRTSAVSGSAANEPVDCFVSGHVQGTRRLCMFLGAGAGHRVDVRAGDVSRFYIEGIRGLTGSVTIRNTDTGYTNEKILIAGSNASVTENVDLLLDCDFAAANFVRFQSQDTSAISFKKIKLRGRVSGVPSSTAVSLGVSSGAATVTYSDIDLSDLQVTVLSGAVRAVYVIPSHAITMRNITLPRVVTSGGTGNVVQIDNTAAATISGLSVPPNFYWRSTDAGSNLLFYSASGTVGSMSIGDGGVFDYAGSGASPVQITNASGLMVGKFRMAQNKTFYVLGSINVAPYIGDQLSQGFAPAGAFVNATDYSGISSFLATSGSATITSLSRIVPGQVITIMFNGGTQSFTDGANMLLNGNFGPATSGDVLKLVCIDPPSGGPLATSTMAEVSRSVN